MSIKVRLIILSLLILILLPGCASTPEKAKVIQIIDGDTIIIQGEHHIRYIGIDTPEKNEPYYEEAKQANQELVGGKVVRLEEDVTDKDKYGRWLRYVYVDDVFINAELVQQGYAYVYPESQFPDIKYYDLLKEAERAAKEAGKGIWGSSS